MASIQKLSVRGVRAFHPEEEEQVIQFCFPLTIIVGANGCGKTTIIEALKYSVTGSLPPGNKSGQAFVHDPKGIGRPTCKANIKLRFTNKAGSPMVVVRSMEVKQNKSSLSFKALDGVIRTTDENGDRITLSHKCTELDRTIPNLMGVSKPILEHVVFCHQEDASWPLMEGAVLKKRFDDIFDSTRYAKALEAIRKLRLKYAGTVKDHKADLAGLAAHQHAAKGFREDMETSREELERVDDSIAGAREEIEEQTEQAEKATKVLLEIERIELESDGVQQQIDIAKATASSFLDACDEDLTQSNTEDKLKSLLHGFDKVILEDESQLKKDLHKQGDIQREIERLGDRKTDIHKDLAKFVAASEARESTLRERLSHAQEMGDKYVLDLDVSQTQSTYGGTLTGTMGTQQSPNSPGAATNMGGGGGRLSLGLSMLSQETLITISADDLNLFLDAISKKRRELQTDKDEHRHRATEHEDEMQKAVSDLTARQRTISAEREKLKAKIVEARHELQRVRSSSSSGQYKIRKSDIEESKRLATKAQKEAQSANSDPRMTVIPQEIRAHEHKITELKAQIDEDQRTLQELRGHADILRQRDMLKRQIMDESEQINETLKENSYVCHKYGIDISVPGEIDDDSADLLVHAVERMANAANEKYGTKSDSLSRSTETRSSIQQKVSEKTALQRHNERNLSNLRDQMNALEGSARGVNAIKLAIGEIKDFEITNGFGSTITDSVMPQDLIQHLTKRISESSAETDSPESIARTMKKLMKMSRATNADGQPNGVICPCCERAMEPNEAAVFRQRMDQLANPTTSDIIVSDRARSRENRKFIQRFEEWRDEISKGTNDFLDHKRISGEKIALERLVQMGSEELKNLNEELKEAGEDVTELTQDTSELRSLVDTMNRLRDDAVKISQKKIQIEENESDMSIAPGIDSSRNLETVERDFERRSKEKEDLMNSIGELNNESAQLNQLAKTASDKAVQMDKRSKEKEERFNEEQKSGLRRNELNELVSKSQQEDKKLDEEMTPLRRQCLAKESDLKRLRASNKMEEDRLNRILNEFTRDAQKFDDLNDKIRRQDESNNSAHQERLNVDLSEIEGSIAEKKSALKEMQPHVELLKKRIDDQDRHRKNIENNIKVFEQRAQEQLLILRKEEFDDHLRHIKESDGVQEKFNAAQSRIRELQDKIARAEGRRSGVKEQVRNLKRKLNTEDYKEIDERTREMMIMYETTQICVKDLEKYHKALDKALLRYHGMKIADINKIIRELWTLVYKGEDITNIELVSGQEGAGKSARSYNYRVVMTKGNSQLDMRGRCSAGQRVLASIVIRLALAETFCISCGVMALDEPTTNLDYANKRGLAIALSHIIATRAQQSNFQLVVITHDEDFVTMMKHELSAHTGFNMPERYFQVAREESSDGKFYSKIRAIDWDEI